MRSVSLRIFVAHPSALLTDHLPHGDGLVAFGFIHALAARGHELHVAAERMDLQAPPPPNMHLYPLTGRDDRGVAGRTGFMWRMRRLYRRLAAEQRFDIMHQLNPVDVGLSLALADVSVPVVLGPYVPDWPGSGAHHRLKAGLRAAQQLRAATVLLSTPAAASELSPLAARSLHVHEVPPGIDPEVWIPPDRAPAHELLYLANLHERKGVLVLLDALSRLAATSPDTRVLVAGDGPLRAEVEGRIQSSPSLRGVSVHGAVERGRVPSLMRDCAVYCLPSFGEPFGMSVLEAMACARPVVVTDAGGPAHLVSDEGGRKVPPGDPEALATALAQLLEDPVLRQSMGEHNRRLVERRYAWPRVIERLENAYAEAIGSRRRLRSS
jgi:L-malate glycosyltransferase